MKTRKKMSNNRPKNADFCTQNNNTGTQKAGGRRLETEEAE